MAAPLSARRSLIEGPIGKSLALFTLPILAGNVLQSINGSVNAIWVGHYLGEAALAATSIANTILFLLLSLVFGIGMASTILVGQRIGAGEADGAKQVVGTGFSAFALGALLIALLGSLGAPLLLGWMQTPLDVMPYATVYLRIVFFGLPFTLIYIYLTMVLRGAGDSKTPMLFLLLSVSLDIALNPLLIFGWGPIPALGIAGSAWATFIANISSLGALMTYLYRRKHFLWLHGDELKYLRPQRHLLGALIGKGLPMGMQMIVMSGSAVVMIGLVNRFGSQTTAAFGAAMQLWNYIQMPAMAVGMAVSSMAAQNVGAGLWKRVDRIALTGVGFGLLLTGVLVGIVFLFSQHALGIFLPNDTDALLIGVHINRIVVWAFLFFSVAMTLMGVVRSTGAVIPPLLILVLALWVVRIPFATSLVDDWPDALWWSYPLGSAVAALLAVGYYRFGGWRKARMITPIPAAATLETATTPGAGGKAPPATAT
ncbi:MAG: MATE family efflux transporter [Dokdonella sp.]